MNIKNICQGNAGLAVTYWGYGIIGCILVGIPLAFVTPGSAPAILAVFLCIMYAILVNVGIWRAAGKYQGPKIWSALAKAAIVVPLVSVVIGIGVAILIPSMSKGNNRQDDGINVPAVVKNVDCEHTMAEARAEIPEIAGLSDDSAISAIQQAYYPESTVERVAKFFCVKLTPAKQPTKLGPIDGWRYESCRRDAAQAPTPQGVNIGIRLCRERFDQ